MSNNKKRKRRWKDPNFFVEMHQTRSRQAQCANTCPSRIQQVAEKGFATLATGDSVPNEGETKIMGCTSSGGAKHLIMQVAGVQVLLRVMKCAKRDTVSYKMIMGRT